MASDDEVKEANDNVLKKHDKLFMKLRINELEERYLRAVDALRMIAEHDMYGAANMRHLAAGVLIDIGEGEA